MLAASIKRLLQRRGRDVGLKRTADGGTYDTSTGDFSGGSVTTETFRGVFVDYAQDDIDGTRIKETDSKLLLAGKDTTMVPRTGDLADSDTYRVISVRKIQDGNELIGYICQVRS